MAVPSPRVGYYNNISVARIGKDRMAAATSVAGANSVVALAGPAANVVFSIVKRQTERQLVFSLRPPPLK